MSYIKRDRLDIMINILELTTEPTKKTRLLYGVGINHMQLKKYLQMLEELGMIKNNDNNEYIITDKGRILLEIMSKSVIIKY
jgi:predicted transcriptional regulator